MILTMETTTLQIPLPKSLKASATAVAKDYGFSSLQEVVRILLNKLSRRQLRVEITEGTIFTLSPRNEVRYRKMDKDFLKGGGNVHRVSGVKSLMQDLHVKATP